MPELIEAKTILSKLKDGPDPYFGITYNMNLYRGCQHQCIYCDSRSKVYGIEDFKKIQIKTNALMLLEKALKQRSNLKGTIGTGSMNDPYMPIERDEKLTRGALALIAEYRYPVHVFTKSNLVVRDMDIIHEIANIYAAVSFTITAANDKLAQVLEPGTVVSSERFKALSTLAEKGIYCGIVLTPVLPYLTDTEENIIEIINRAKESGASYVLGWMGMTQREGQREYYYQKLDEYFPGLRQKYIRCFGNSYECAPENAEKLQQVFYDSCRKNNLSTKMEFYRDNAPEQLNLFNL